MAPHTPRREDNVSANSITELQSVPAALVRDPISAQAVLDPKSPDNTPNGDVHGQMPPPATAVDALERWNSPKGNRWRLIGTFICVFSILVLHVKPLHSD
jgi:hypothetical protein